MIEKLITRLAFRGCVIGFFALTSQLSGATEAPITQEQFLILQRQNEILQQQLHQQQETIDLLTHKVSEIQGASAQQDRELSELKTENKPGKEAMSEMAGPLHLGKVDISGEGGVAFFHSQSKGATPNAEFRIDEAKIFIEAPIWNDVYFFTELNLAAREETDLNLRVGELYLDFENVSQLWGRDRMLNLRVGRFYIPFGEEYQNRFAIANPLISHSVSDLWGADEGVEVYGALGKAQYILAVQNGGAATTRDFNADKAVAGRVGYDPTKWLHLSVSGMRTGDLDAVNDGISELWFANGWIRSIGSGNTTRFHANLVEGDVRLRFPGWAMRAAGGYINYGDNDPVGSNQRDVYYYYVEGVKDITKQFYGAARFSEILAPGGFPIVGNGDMGTYFGPVLTTEYWRLSLGLGYRFSSNLLVKGEYSINQGRELGGEKRNHENVFAMEAAFKF